MSYNKKPLHKHKLLAALVLITAAKVAGQPSSAIYSSWQPGFTKTLHKTHDMALPAWGPYSTRFNGISHVPAENTGLRFDVIVQPSLYFRNVTPLGSTQRETDITPGKPVRIFLIFLIALSWSGKTAFIAMLHLARWMKIPG
ncbi:hypothetical protein [Niabella hibiscisoli]|uniref:hypothetical protein n=1 Tax=Niabella hibiscisoli TaxID=1825928 RepID=UPI001F103338|nr:hypothetical protein [Niabella hibiscisoli]MCH5720033.1 hypothetical protein [Niabella hibiscisoli]